MPRVHIRAYIYDQGEVFLFHASPKRWHHLSLQSFSKTYVLVGSFVPPLTIYNVQGVFNWYWNLQIS